MATTTFHRFPDLPTEIRLQIWRETLPFTDGIVATYDWRWFAMGLYEDVNMPISNGRELSHKRKIQIPVPTALFINGESRSFCVQWMAKEGLKWQHLWGLASDWVENIEGSAQKYPVKKVLARDWDVKRDYVYLGWEREHEFQHWTLEGLEQHLSHTAVGDFDIDSEGSMAPFPTSWSISASPPPPHAAVTKMRHLVVPAFMGYSDTSLMVDILKYRQVEKLYVLWGKLPQPTYAYSGRPGEHWEIDVQPCWRLEPIRLTGANDVDNEVEMYTYVSKAQDPSRMAGNEADLSIEKGSLSEWMEKLRRQLKEAAADHDALRSDSSLSSFLKELEILPVRLVVDGHTGSETLSGKLDIGGDEPVEFRS